jgi:hypothetical protein
VEPPPPPPEETEGAPPPSLTLSQNSEEEVEASEPDEPQQTQEQAADDSATQEIVPIVQRQEVLEEEEEEDIFPPPLTNTTTSSNGTAGNETVVNGTTPEPDEEEVNTVVLTLPPQESTNLDISMLIDALNEGLLSNDDITLTPGEREGEFIAIIGPTTTNSLVLNVTDLLQMLGPDATIDIDCEGEGCEVSKEIESEFRKDVATVLGTGNRRLLLNEQQQQLSIRQRQSTQDELVQIRLGCGPQTLRTNIADGNQSFELNILLSGPGITECVDDDIDVESGEDFVAPAQIQEEEEEEEVVVERESAPSSKSNMKVIAPVVAVVGAAVIGCLAYGTIVFLNRKKEGRMSDHISIPPESPGGSDSDFGGGGGGVVVSSKLAENESAIHSFGRRTEDPSRFSTPKLLHNSHVVTSLGASTGGQATSHFTNPYNNAFEDSSLIQVSNPGRNTFAVAEQVAVEETTTAGGSEVDGDVAEEKKKKKKRKGMKRWFPINLEANSLKKGKGPMKKKMSPENNPSFGDTPRRSLVDTFQSMDTAVHDGGSSSMFSSPEVQQSFKVIQQLIDEDDVE